MYYIAEGQEVSGPIAEDQLIAMWRAGKIAADAYVCPQGTQGWKLAVVFLGGMDKIKANLAPVPAKASKMTSWKLESERDEPDKMHWFFKTCLVILVMIVGGVSVVKNAQRVAQERRAASVERN